MMTAAEYFAEEDASQWSPRDLETIRDAKVFIAKATDGELLDEYKRMIFSQRCRSGSMSTLRKQARVSDFLSREIIRRGLKRPRLNVNGPRGQVEWL